MGSKWARFSCLGTPLRRGASDSTKIWWMLPMCVRDNRKKYELETQKRRQERASQVRDLHLKLCNLGPTLASLPRTALNSVENRQMKGNSAYYAHTARLLRAEGFSRARYLPNMSANHQKSFCCTRWTLLTHFGTHLVGLPLAPCRSPLGLGTGSYRQLPSGGCQNGSTRSTGCKKKTFCNNDLGHHGMPKQVFLARFELVVARFGPPEMPKCLEIGLFCNQKWVKNGSKMCFSKMILDHLGCLNN